MKPERIEIQQTSEMSSERAPGRVTSRAFVFGLITIAGALVYATYFGRVLVKSFLPMTALLPLVVWVGINAVLKLAFPRLVLSRTEVLTIFANLRDEGLVEMDAVALLGE